MKHSLTKYYRKEKKRVLEKCKECGVCAKRCPIIKTTELADVSPKEIQEQIKAYLKTGEANRTVIGRTDPEALRLQPRHRNFLVPDLSVPF
jgi:Fe-S oxidoreductase